MQGPSLYPQMNPQFPEHERLKCPRCDSENTKFCYYNNYNLSQPRHYCKNCRRYWTKGGALRNIPVGGGSRKSAKRSGSGSKRALSPCTTPPSSSNTTNQKVPKSESLAGCPLVDHHRRLLDTGGSFSSLLAGNGQFRSLIEGFNSNGFGKSPTLNSDLGSEPNMTIRNPIVESQAAANKTEICLGAGKGGDSSCGTGSNCWPDLAIYAPGSTFQ